MILFSSVWKCVNPTKLLARNSKDNWKVWRNCILIVYNNIIRRPRSSFDRIFIMLIIIFLLYYKFYMNEKFENKHGEVPKERRLPWHLMKWLIFLDVHTHTHTHTHTYIRNRIIQLFYAYLRSAFVARFSWVKRYRHGQVPYL